MREIKFRQFKNGQFHYWGNVDKYGFTNPLSNNPDLESQQYTGLKDKNGVEIYEGDILAFERTRNFKKELILPFAVEWDYESAGWTQFSPKNMVEVIGNIYENHELLK